MNDTEKRRQQIFEAAREVALTKFACEIHYASPCDPVSEWHIRQNSLARKHNDAIRALITLFRADVVRVEISGEGEKG